MPHSRDPELTSALDAIATHRASAGIVTDIDGTICPIAPKPDEARVSEEMRGLLRELVEDFSLVALLSGRNVDDMLDMVPIPDLVMIGNHGMEWLSGGSHCDAPEAAPFRAVMAEVAREIADRVGPDVIVQPKGLSVSLHYRLAADPAAAQDRLLALVRPMLAARELRLQHGRFVIDVRPDCAVDKGTALERVVREWELDRVLVLGDDATDAAAFETLGRLRREGVVEGVSVAVVTEEAPKELSDSADVHVAGPGEVAVLLRGLRRTASSSASLS